MLIKINDISGFEWEINPDFISYIRRYKTDDGKVTTHLHLSKDEYISIDQETYKRILSL